MGYDNGTHVDISEGEEKQIRNVVRKHVFCGLKFVPGEGAPTGRALDAPGNRTGDETPQKRRKRGPAKIDQVPEFGASHERPDLTKETGYAWKIIMEMGMDKDDGKYSDLSRAIWWKCVHGFVKHEIQQLRGNRSSEMKKSIIEG